MYPGCKKNNWPSINGPGSNVSFSFAFVELLIAQYDVLNQFNKEELKTVLKEVINNYDKRNLSDYSVFSKKHTLLIAGRIMFISNYPPFINEYNDNIYLKDFIDKIMLSSNYETLDLVYNNSSNFLNQNY
jgi:hypothetical protein